MIEAELVNLAQCICEQLAEVGQGPTCWCGLYPGQQVSWEFCQPCDNDAACGMGYVQARLQSPFEEFPFPLGEGGRCDLPQMMIVAAGVVRCMPVGSEDGDPPTVDELMETSVGMLQDRRAIFCAIRDCIPGAAIQSWLPLGPQGGCVGGEFTFAVQI